MTLEEKARNYKYFSVETTDFEVFKRVCERANVPKNRTWIDIGDEREGFLDYFCADIDEIKKLCIATNGENGKYLVYARKRKDHRKSELIYTSAQRN